MTMMNFRVLRPCADCPFRKDKPLQKGWLGKERATEIANAILEENKTFACHKTLDKEHSHCAGALILIHHYKPVGKAYFGNALIQVAERLGLYEPDKLDDESIPCFTDKQEFIDWHTNDNSE